MKKYVVWALAICLGTFFFSCNTGSSKKEIEQEVYASYLKKGDEISNLTQGVLLANVGKAIQQGGAEFAVEFCNLKASSLVDSLNNLNNCTISRVSAKNRNSGNQLQGKDEKEIWSFFSDSHGVKKDTILIHPDKLTYYKSIKIGMPACLKCHGTPNQDIDAVTFEKLQKLYPNDLATGYKMDDFRGLWKIEFTRN